MSGEGQLVRACEQSESDKDQPKLATTIAATTPDRYNDAQLNFHQPINEPEKYGLQRIWTSFMYVSHTRNQSKDKIIFLTKAKYQRPIKNIMVQNR
jgi:hypothetical protein